MKNDVLVLMRWFHLINIFTIECSNDEILTIHTNIIDKSRQKHLFNYPATVSVVCAEFSVIASGALTHFAGKTWLTHWVSLFDTTWGKAIPNGFALANPMRKWPAFLKYNQTTVWSHTSWHPDWNSYDGHNAKEFYALPSLALSAHGGGCSNNFLHCTTQTKSCPWRQDKIMSQIHPPRQRVTRFHFWYAVAPTFNITLIVKRGFQYFSVMLPMRFHAVRHRAIAWLSSTVCSMQDIFMCNPLKRIGNHQSREKTLPDGKFLLYSDWI